MKVSAHNREWCSVSVVLEGRPDAQPQFMRWLKKSVFSRIELTGVALAPLRKAQMVKPRAPISTLIAVDELANIGICYNARNPRHPIQTNFDGLVWKGTFALEDLPAPKSGKHLTGEAAPKRAKLDTAINIENDWLSGNWWPEQEHEKALTAWLAHLDFDWEAVDSTLWSGH